jgi:hypothetical protein
VANRRLKVVVFSMSCGVLVRVAGKGLRRRKSKVGRSRLKERKAEKLNAETQSSQRSRDEGMEAGVG